MLGMSIDLYSFITSILLFSTIVLVMFFLRKNTLFIAMYGVNIIIITFIFFIIRLFLPLNLYWAKVIETNFLYSPLESLLTYRLFGSYTVGSVILYIWLLGACISIIFYTISCIREFIYLNNISSIENPVVNSILINENYKKTIVHISPQISTPMVWGVFFSHIYLPDLDLSKKDWINILDHEMRHIENHDTIIKGILLFLSSIFWWNPVMHLFVKETNYILELRCDCSLVYDKSAEVRASYLSTILNVIKQHNSAIHHPTYMSATLVSSSEYEKIKQRFFVVSHSKKSHFILDICCFCFIFFVFICSYFIVLQPAYQVPPSSIPGDTTSTFILHTSDNQYLFFIDGTQYSTLKKSDLKKPKYSTIEIIEGDQQ